MQRENGTGYKCGSSHREVFCQSLGSRITCNIQDWAICDIIWLSKNSISDAAGVLDLPGDINYLFVLITVLTFHAYKKYMPLFFFFFFVHQCVLFLWKVDKKELLQVERSFYISRHPFSQIFRTSFNIIWKKYFHHERWESGEDWFDHLNPFQS